MHINTGWLTGGVVLIMPTLWGCVSFKQVQHFAVRDPDTGAANYYRLTVKGYSGIGAQYHMQAGYFSAAAVDILRGQMPKIPTIDLPIEREKTFDRLLEYIDAVLLQQAKQVAPLTDPEPLLNAATDRMHRAMQEHEQLGAQREKIEAQMKNAESMLAANQRAVEEAKSAIRTLEKEIEDLKKKEGQGDAQAKADLPSKQLSLKEANTKLSEAERARRFAERNKNELSSDQRLADARLAAFKAVEEAANARMTKLTERYKDETLGLSRAQEKPALLPAELDDLRRGTDERYVELARLLWFNSLASSDIVSVGMTEELDPFEFRKLVFWTTATAVDLNEIAGEIDGIADSVVKIAQTYKNVAGTRQAQQVRQQQLDRQRAREALKMLKEDPSLDAGQKLRLDTLIRMLIPESAADPSPSVVPEGVK